MRTTLWSEGRCFSGVWIERLKCKESRAESVSEEPSLVGAVRRVAKEGSLRFRFEAQCGVFEGARRQREASPTLLPHPPLSSSENTVACERMPPTHPLTHSLTFVWCSARTSITLWVRTIAHHFFTLWWIISPWSSNFSVGDCNLRRDLL